MKASIRLFRWRGIDVGVHWSLLVVVVIVAWGLADSALPAEAAGYSSSAYWVAGIVTGSAFIASIAAHELGHAVVAQRRGIRVSSIVLWLFGGVASLETQPSTWQAELAVGFAGPLVSIVLGAAGLAAAGIVGASTTATLVRQSLVWFGSTSLILAAFNLLPGAPLDGGRVVSAVRWRHHGDANRARAEAARSGVAVSQGLVGLGIALAFFGRLDTGLWLAFLGWFLGSAARREVVEEQTRHALSNVTVGSTMTVAPTTVPSTMNLGELVTDVLPRVRGTSIPVVDGGSLRGLITPDHLRRVPPQRWWTTLVGVVATPASGVVTAREDERLVDVMDRVTVPNERIIVLDEDQRVIGLITPTDITRVARTAALREAARSSGR